jgi:hypothetical protein
VPSTVAYQKENMTISCKFAFTLSQDDSVYTIKLSKKSSGSLNTIVMVEYSTPAGRDNNYRSITWIDTDLKTRADADESVIYPPRSAKLVFVIPMDNMKCTDDGTYVCVINGFTNTVLNERSEGTVEFKGKI